jgi:hypothetical protein
MPVSGGRVQPDVLVQQPVDRLVHERAIDPGLQIEGEQLGDGGGGLGHHGDQSRYASIRPGSPPGARGPVHFNGCSSAKNRKQGPLEAF